MVQTVVQLGTSQLFQRTKRTVITTNLTSTVISSSNDDSDYFRNQEKISKRKKHKNEKLSFLSTICWTIWCELVFVKL